MVGVLLDMARESTGEEGGEEEIGEVCTGEEDRPGEPVNTGDDDRELDEGEHDREDDDDDDPQENPEEEMGRRQGEAEVGCGRVLEAVGGADSVVV